MDSDEDLGLSPSLPADSDLNLVASIARRQVELEDALAANEAEAKRLREELQIVSEKDLPTAMAAAGLSKIALAENGGEVSVSLKYRCGQLDDLPDDPKRPRRSLEERLAAFAWLEQEGHSDLAKQVISVTLTRGQEALADEIMKYLESLRSNSLDIKRARTVVWGTLSAFAKEQDRQLAEPPLELLGVSKVHVATIKRERKELS